MARYARSSKAPDTQYFQFKIIREQKGGEVDGVYDHDIGYSPISRWLAFVLDYEDFISNPNATGHMIQCQIPVGTIIKDCIVRVDKIFSSTGSDDIDIGDTDQTDGWADGLDFTSTGLKHDTNAAYTDKDADPNPDVAGMQLYMDGDTVDVLFKNGTPPVAGRAILFLETISYHEKYEAEW